jgi:hypothetical protein
MTGETMEKWQVIEWQLFVLNLALGTTILFSLGVLIEKWGKSLKIPLIISGIFTFHFVAFCWIFFRAGAIGSILPSGDLLGKVLSKLASITFDPSFIMEVNDKTPYVLPAILFGFILHFSPVVLKENISHWFSKQSFVIQAILVSLVITSVLILNTQRTVPFIYFQF